MPPRLLLELGGKDAAYVRADADVERAVRGCICLKSWIKVSRIRAELPSFAVFSTQAAAIAGGAFSNAGQSCCSVERVYVHADVAARFTAALCAATSALRPGHDLAPLARGVPAARLLTAHIADAVANGATIAFRTPPERMPPGESYDAARDDGKRVLRRPLYFPATVLVGCDHAMAAMRDESFGPIVCVQAVRSDGEAAALMNDSMYGLTAAVFSADEAAATAILRRLVRASLLAVF